MAGWLDGWIESIDMSLSKLWEIVKDRKAWCCSPRGGKESDTTKSLNNNIKVYTLMFHILH